MKREWLSGVVFAGFAASAVSAQQVAQWRVQDGGNGHWYEIVVHEAGRPWQQAADAAIARGGHLATLTSVAEHSFAMALVGTTGPWFAPGGLYPDVLQGPWLGARRASLAAPWTWVTGEPWAFTAFCSNQPSNQAAVCLEPELCLHVKLGADCFGPQQGWGDLTATGVCSPEIEGLTASLVEYSADCNADGVVDFGQIRQGSLADSNANNIPDCCEESAQCPLAALEWSLSSGGNGHWYALKRVFPSQSPESLFSLAAELGGHAATITSAAENEFCRQFVVPWEGTLIGLRKLQGTNQVAWITGEPVTYINWNSGEGSNIGERYALIQPASGRWHDTDLTPRQVVLVEFSADCNGDGLVDFGQIREGSLADSNANNIPDCCEGGSSCSQCPADVVEDGVVNGVDLAAVVNAWGTDGGKLARSDVDGSGEVDAVDLAAILSAWGPCQP